MYGKHLHQRTDSDADAAGSMIPDKPVVGFIGAGKVGQTLARLLYQAGYTIGAVHSRTVDHAESLARQVDSAAVTNPHEVLERADLVVLTVPDQALDSLAVRLAVGDLSGRGVIHTSGVYDATILSALTARGAMTGSLHPAYPFADVEVALIGLTGVTFAIEAEVEPLMVWLGDMVRALNGSILKIPPGQKALYHAALVLASNYTVTLYAAAERLLLSFNKNREAVDGVLNALVGATTANLRDQGIPAALTGPLVREDVETIAAHLAALEQQDRELAEVYRSLARLSLPMLQARGIPTEAVENLLSRK